MIDISKIPSPCYVLEEELLRKNLSLIKSVADEAGVEIILAFKGFSMWGAFPIVREYIKGATASSLNEAKLCVEEMKSKSHTYCVAIDDNEIDELISLSSHLTFNSLTQFDRFKAKALEAVISCGIRVNPQYSEVTTDLYNPCSPNSRLGVTSEHFGDKLPEGIEGIHFHALCENDSYALEKTLEAFEQRFGHLIKQAKWVNMGGGHLMTRQGYDTKHLIKLLRAFKQRYNVHVILEPGSAFAWQTGVLVSKVLDIVEANGIKTAMLDVSFTAHMPDCLEMPYKPRITGANMDPQDPKFGIQNFVYRMGGTSCLSGDYMFEYSFDKQLQVGDRIVFEDMIHYTMVKTSFFNGVKHPSIGIWNKNNTFTLLREFGYQEYKNKLS
ncbi:MAG TPA: carboxynorspermidine decarboxylase [Flavobacteriales bacterium]|nr:carboxynorspermidine decarboxylase [Flavobacteriales bacterium]